LALHGGRWLSCPGCSTSGKEPQYPVYKRLYIKILRYKRLGGSQGQSGQVQKISPPPGFGPQNIQPLASLHTNYIIPVHKYKNKVKQTVVAVHAIKEHEDDRVKMYVHFLNSIQDGCVVWFPRGIAASRTH
jgi:hypothetical protein